MKKNHRLNTILIIALTLGFGFTLSVVNAGPPIAVTSAEPDEVVKETEKLTLAVKINGRGFDRETNIQFCLSATNTDAFCDNGRVVVKSVKFINSKKLEVSVTVAAEATTGKFNIEAFSSGRRGRGIEKFSVLKVGGGASELLQASFDLTIVSTDEMEGDGLVYQDNGKDHVQVSTGPVPGLRFDTNLQNAHRAGKFAKARLVYMDIGAGVRTQFEIDFRFNLPTGGLDLGSLVAQNDAGACQSGGCTGTVAAWIRYYAGGVVSGLDVENWGKLGFGAIHANINDIDQESTNAARECLEPTTGAPDRRKILVTRTSRDTWTLESNADGKACRFALGKTGEEDCATVACSFVQSDDEIDFKFKFLLKIQPE